MQDFRPQLQWNQPGPFLLEPNMGAWVAQAAILSSVGDMPIVLPSSTHMLTFPAQGQKQPAHPYGEVTPWQPSMLSSCPVG